MGKILKSMEAQFRPGDKCLVRVVLDFNKGTDWQLAKAQIHRVCAELLEANVEMEQSIGKPFRGVIYVETGGDYVNLEGADEADLDAAVLLTEFVHDSTELME